MKFIVQKINRSLYYGWVIVILSAMTFFLSAPGQSYSIGIFKEVYLLEFGFSETLISSAYSIATLISGSLLVFMGKAVDKYGVRKMLLIVTIMLSLTTFFNSYVSNIYMMFFGFFLLRYFGQGSMTLIPSTLIPQWFEKRRAFALSVATIGGLLAMLLVPSLNLWLISSIGWQNAWRVWGLILLVGFVPIVFVFTSNKPEDIGITIENDTSVSEENIKAVLLEIDNVSFSLKEAIKTKEFWIVGMISMIPAMFSTGIAFHITKLMGIRGISGSGAALILGFLALPAFIMPFVSKLVVHKYQVRYVLLTTLSMTIISMFYLMFGVLNFTTAVIFIIFYGLAVAIQSLSTNVFWPDNYGRKHLGSIRGAATVFMVIGSALGPLPFGIAYDLNGNYLIAIIGMIAFTTIALLLSFFISKPKKRK